MLFYNKDNHNNMNNNDNKRRLYTNHLISLGLSLVVADTKLKAEVYKAGVVNLEVVA